MITKRDFLESMYGANAEMNRVEQRASRREAEENRPAFVVRRAKPHTETFDEWLQRTAREAADRRRAGR